MNRYVSHIRTLLGLALDWGAIKVVPKCVKTAEKTGRMRVVTEEEEVEICAYLRQRHSTRRAYIPDVADLCEVLVDTGMRLGEALAITYRECIDLHSRTIHLYPDQTKNGTARNLPMTKRVHALHTKRQGMGKDDTPWSFTNYYQVDPCLGCCQGNAGHHRSSFRSSRFATHLREPHGLYGG